MGQELTFGEKACGLLNPSDGSAVTECKAVFADIIDTLNSMRDESVNPEVKRMLSLAITDAQTSQMWAVKAITWRY
jgi:hypothetical protein